MKYYSEKLNKLFDTEKELVAAEKELADKEAKKAELAKSKKADANKVEEAFKARNAARREYNTKVMDARKAYNTALVEAKKAFNDAIAEATNAKDKAEEAYNTALTDFTSKHPEGYHMTLKDGDNVMTISNSSDKHFERMDKEFNSLIDSLLNIWKL
jgi:seryl-tRNA synthetase